MLIEIVLDLGREAEIRYDKSVIYLSDIDVINKEDINYVISHIGEFGQDRRAGIEKTLHRISGIQNRKGEIIGLTCRVGRAIQGTVDIIKDIVESGKNILIMGVPGVGKTTKLREIARILSTEMKKRVIVIDTSNEIAGDGDIPHPAIGRARRMQVNNLQNQHSVMIEAVENHMPEVIIIDEISTAEETFASRTIAERGVQLIATAHGATIENIIANPTLNDLIGGIQSVTLGDEEARRRNSQKTILERKSPPTFDIIIELQDRNRLAIHKDVAEVVDNYLRFSSLPDFEIRTINEEGIINKITETPEVKMKKVSNFTGNEDYQIRIFPYGVSRSQLEKLIKTYKLSARVTKSLDDTDMLFILKSYYKPNNKILKSADNKQIAVFVVKSNNVYQLQKTLREALHLDNQQEESFEEFDDELEEAIEDVNEAVDGLLKHINVPIELIPREFDIIKIQQKIAKENKLNSEIVGIENERRLRIYPRGII
jgi:stage III sporulation protein SpoIIIAA